MQQKITFSEACRLIGRSTGIPRQEVDEFLRSLFEVMEQALIDGESVKLKGIGTFKTTTIAERKSVDVNTGKEIILPAHSKLIFTPAKELAAAVNSPFEAFEAIELTDNISEEDLAAVDNEISETSLQKVETPAETPVAPLAPFLGRENDGVSSAHSSTYSSDETTYIEDDPASLIDDDKHEEECKDKSEEPCNVGSSSAESLDECTEYSHDALEAGEDILNEESEDMEQPVEDEINKATEYINGGNDSSADDIIEEDEPLRHRNNHNSERRKKRRFAFIIGFMCALLLICVAGILILLICPDTANRLRTKLTGPSDVQVESVDTVITSLSRNKQPETKDISIEQASVPHNDEAPKSDDSIAPTSPSDTPVVYDKVTETRYLGTIARHHYGNYFFWPYIYEANPGLGHPDRIKPGTRVKVPDLKQFGIDPHDKAAIEEAKRKEREIYNRYTSVSARRTKKNNKR